MPEDSATLYIQFADAMLKVDPALKSGAPVFQGINQDASVWPGAHGNMSWFGRLYDYLKLHNRQGDLKLASFEIYPYEACTMKWDDLYRNPELTHKTLQAFRDDGLPAAIPLMNTESNLCGSLSVYMSDIFSVLWLADNVGSFVAEGGALYIHSPFEPSGIEHCCQGWAIWGHRPLGPRPRRKDHWLYRFLPRQPDDQSRGGDTSHRHPSTLFRRCRNRGLRRECSGHQPCRSAPRRPLGLVAHQQR